MARSQKIVLGALLLIGLGSPAGATEDGGLLYHCVSSSGEWRVNVFQRIGTTHPVVSEWYSAGVRQQVNNMNIRRGFYSLSTPKNVAGKEYFRGWGFSLEVRTNTIPMPGIPGHLKAILEDGTRLEVDVTCSHPHSTEG